ncbi:MAG: histidine kinase [Sphingomonadaceae bacterium]|nr:histidine kinase [Sphingomonadaceae bacterium]
MPSLKSHARWTEALRTTLALWLFVLFIFLPGIIGRHQGEPWTGVAIDCSTILVSMAFAMAIFLVSRATIDWPPYLRLPVRALAVLAAAGANTIFDLMFQGWIANHFVDAWHSLPSDLTRAYSSMRNYTLVFGVNMILFHVNYARRAAIQQERQLSEANVAAQQAQLAALRYQLNPHFLFNSLNSISALIVTGRNKDAESMTNRLSAFLRASLNATPTELIPLDEELALTEEYLDIESVRFGERLSIAVDCADAACDALVPGFLVQPLVENAVKHAVARSRAPVEIRIQAAMEGRTLRIDVANDLPADDEDDHLEGAGAGVGIDNVRRRLEAVFGKRATLTSGTVGGRFVATIRIPDAQTAN